MSAQRTDIEIARAHTMKPIGEVAAAVGLTHDDLIQYGEYKAKVKYDTLCRLLSDTRSAAPLILVSATNPTPAGEGKTTCSIGLTQALCKLGHKATVALREPSMGPVFGRKGGAAGGGLSQVLPMEDINLHFTGDLHAVAAANNLIAAVLDNELHFDNRLQIDHQQILWRRAIDMNDRSLRHFTFGNEKGSPENIRQGGFDITAASEIMGILCLSKSYTELKERIGCILLGFRKNGEPVTVSDLGIQGAAAVLLREALLPNLVQTMEYGPALIHGGPFANIAQGTNSVLATRLAQSFSDYVVTEAGFGFDLGGEKFFDLVGPYGGFTPSAVVIVSTARSLKLHGGVSVANLEDVNAKAVERGMVNLHRHLENVRKFGAEPVVAINRFPHDSDDELQVIRDGCRAIGVQAEVVEVHARGGEGGIALAEAVVAAVDQSNGGAKPLYGWEQSIEEKIAIVAREIYGADGVDYTEQGRAALALIKSNNLAHLPVCIAKTEKSLSDDAGKLGRPHGFRITVRDIRIAAGAGFVVPLTGTIMRMPGLPKRPAATSIDIDDQGNISGLA